MDERTTGLIIRTRPLTETSLIVHWLAPDAGRIATVARGARRPKSPFLGKLDLFYRAEFSFQRSRKSELHALREVSVLDFHEAFRRDFTWLQQVSYFAQLVEQMTETETPLPDIFDLLSGALEFLPRQKSGALTVFAFEMKLLDELGLHPDLAASSLSAGAREITSRLPQMDWETLLRLRLSEVQRIELRRFLQTAIAQHAGSLLSARAKALGME